MTWPEWALVVSTVSAWFLVAWLYPQRLRRRRYVPFPGLRRVHTRSGSHIEPRCSESWTDLERLRWHAAVVRADTGGVLFDVEPAEYCIGGIRQPGYYDVRFPRGSCGPMTASGAWDYLNGISLGVNLGREPAPSPPAPGRDTRGEP